MDAILELGLLNGAIVAALAVVVVGVTWLCRRPALAHALWLLVLIKLITPPLVPVEVPRPEPFYAASEKQAGTKTDIERAIPLPSAAASAIPEATGFASEGDEPNDILDEKAAEVTLSGASGGRQAPEPTTANRGLTPPARPSASFPFSWQTCLVVLWLAGSCLWWCLAAWRLDRFRRLLHSAGLACPEVQARADGIAQRLGLSHCPRIWLLPAPLPPLLWSLLGPATVFLPERLWAELTVEQQDALLAHELAHYKRRDHWVRWLELLALGLYWWHPAAWLARRGLHEAEELLCDARVLRALPAAADAYAQALIQTVAFLSGPRLALPGAASGMGHVRPLKARIIMLMRGTNADRLPWAGAWALTGLGLMLLVLRPVWADSPGAAPAQERTIAVGQPEPPVPTGTVRGLPAQEHAPVPIQPPRDRPSVPIVVGQIRSGPGMEPPPVDRAPLAAAEQVELLKVQLAAKEAELHEARAMLKLAEQRLKRMSQLHRQGTLGQDELEQAQADAEVQQARVRGKEAMLREAQLRLSQAARASGGRRKAGQAGADNVSVEPMNSYGGRPGARVIAPGTAPAGPATTPAPVNALPGGMPGYGAPAVPGMPAPRGGAPALQERLDRLESRLEMLLREIQTLRNEISENRRRAPGGGRPPATSSLPPRSNPFGGPGEVPPGPDSPARP